MAFGHFLVVGILVDRVAAVQETFLLRESRVIVYFIDLSKRSDENLHPVPPLSFLSSEMLTSPRKRRQGKTRIESPLRRSTTYREGMLAVKLGMLGHERAAVTDAQGTVAAVHLHGLADQRERHRIA